MIMFRRPFFGWGAGAEVAAAAAAEAEAAEADAAAAAAVSRAFAEFRTLTAAPATSMNSLRGLMVEVALWPKA